MAEFRISGVWKNSNNVITHYAFHQVIDSNTLTRAEKVSKATAIIRIETIGNNAKTWIWNYRHAQFEIGESVEVVNGASGKYLRSKHDNTVCDNLDHLINCDWFIV